MKHHRHLHVADLEIVYTGNVSGDGGLSGVPADDRDGLPGLSYVAVELHWRVGSGEETVTVGVPANPPSQLVLLPGLQR